MGQALGVGVAGLLIARISTATLLIGGAAGVLLVALNFGHRLARRLERRAAAAGEASP